MSDLIASLWTPQLQMAVMLCVGVLVVLYVLSIVWVIRDAYRRADNWLIWGVVALIPFLGAFAYCLMRKPLYKLDQDEQELEIKVKQRELMKYGDCSNCGYPVENDFVLCPRCHTRLKNMCPACRKALDPTWQVCPYCATQIGNMQARRRQPMQPQQAMPRQQAMPQGAAPRY